MISDSVEKVIEKDEIISFNKFKIHELTTNLNRAISDSGKKSEISEDFAEYKKQIEKLKEERDALKALLNVNLKN